MTLRAYPGTVYWIRVGSWYESGAYQLNYPDGAAATGPLDQTAPVVDAPSAVKAIATHQSDTAVTWTATATDDTDGAVPVTCSPPSGSGFPVGSTNVTCSAADEAGNQAQATFPVAVTYAWSGFHGKLGEPAPAFRRGRDVEVKFNLIPPSDAITALTPSVHLAPVAAGGTVGTEVAQPVDFDRRRNGTWTGELETRTLTRGVWQLRLDLGDGEPHIAALAIR